ncbi:MAG TPA: orotate phosphoribosyltransferase [Longimicrobiaceae bacterium]|nr:orotate phosphoribosyltransferase [Longimicrobiaceae bacterium]
MTHRDRLIELLRERSLEIGDFVLTSGARSGYYVDCRRTTMHAEGQVLIGQLGWELLKGSGLDPQAVGGLTMGADPVTYALAYTSWLAGEPVHAFSVRKQAKEHGKGKRIEGCFEPGQRVVVIEDVITTGGSAIEACSAVETEGGEVLAVLAVLDRESGGRERIEAEGYRLLSLFRIAELLAGHASGTAAG